MLLISRFTFLCDIRECYLFLDSRFFATCGNVVLYCCELLSPLLLSRFALSVWMLLFSLPGGGGRGCATEWACWAAGCPHRCLFGVIRSGGWEEPGPLPAIGSRIRKTWLCGQSISTQKTSAPNKYAGLLQALEKKTCLPNVSARCPNIPSFSKPGLWKQGPTQVG